MAASPSVSANPQTLSAPTAQLQPSRDYSLEAFIAQPIDDAEWVDGQITQRTGMTVKHGVVQGQLSRLWGNYAEAIQEGGKSCTEAPCCTLKQVRRPDVAYIPATLLAQHGQPATFPQSFPLIAEIASPTDSAEDLFAKATEYLESGCQEIWLIFPEARWVLVLTTDQHLWFTAAETVSTQVVLTGFSIAVQELLS